jgi:hypothetical protein
MCTMKSRIEHQGERVIDIAEREVAICWLASMI